MVANRLQTAASIPKHMKMQMVIVVRHRPVIRLHLIMGWTEEIRNRELTQLQSIKMDRISEM